MGIIRTILAFLMALMAGQVRTEPRNPPPPPRHIPSPARGPIQDQISHQYTVRDSMRALHRP